MNAHCRIRRRVPIETHCHAYHLSEWQIVGRGRGANLFHQAKTRSRSPKIDHFPKDDPLLHVWKGNGTGPNPQSGTQSTQPRIHRHSEFTHNSELSPKQRQVHSFGFALGEFHFGIECSLRALKRITKGPGVPRQGSSVSFGQNPLRAGG